MDGDRVSKPMTKFQFHVRGKGILNDRMTRLVGRMPA